MRSISLFGNGALRTLYDEAGLSAKIRRSLNLMIVGHVFGSAYNIICGGGTTAMIGLATELGANDMIFGILSAIPQVAALTQLPLSILVNRKQHRKKYMMILGLISRIPWLFFGLLPYIFPMAPAAAHLWTIVFLLGITSCCGSIVSVCWLPWFSDLAPSHIRGRWLSIRESFLAASNIIIGIVSAYLLDSLPADIRYAVIFLIGGTVGILDIVSFGFCVEQYSAPPQKQSFFSTFGEVLRNKPFMNLVIMWTVWSFSANLSGVYLNPYSMNEMGLSFMQITVFASIASAVVSIVAMPFWGKMVDRFGCRNVMLVSGTVAALTPLFYLFSSPGNIWPTLLHNTVGAMFWCGSNLTANTMQLTCSPDKNRPTYIAVFCCITAFAGATLGSLAGGGLLEFWNSRNMFTGTVDRYQVLFILSCVLRLGGVLLLAPRFEADSDLRPKDLIRCVLRPFGNHSKRA